jgi:DNA-binding MarR family transcriptional regulator
MTDGATAALTLVADPAPAETAGRPSPGSQQESREKTVAWVADSFGDSQRTVRRWRARLLAAAGDDVDSAAKLLLHTVATEGPMRSSALAASVQADLSTVSRQVASLVSRGLLERRADQLDGRASLLAVTGAGEVALAEREQGRQAFYDEVLADWSDEEMRQFARQLERFTAAYDRVSVAMGDRGSHQNSRAAQTPAPELR